MNVTRLARMCSTRLSILHNPLTGNSTIDFAGVVADCPESLFHDVSR